MKRRYIALGALVPVFALLLPFQPAVGAADDGDATTSPQQLQSAEEIRFSPEEMAESYKLEAEAEWQPAAGRIATEIRDQYPDAFVAARSTFTTFTVVFAGAAPEGALRMLDAVPVDVEIVERVGVPEATVLKIVDSITNAVVPLAGPSQGFSVYPDPEKMSVQIDLYPVAGVDRSDVPMSEFEAAVRNAIAPLDSRGVVVSVSARDTPGGVDSTSYGQAGGTPLNLSSTGAAACTSGFVVKDNNGPDLGVYTSAHCANNLRQANTNGNPNFNFDFRAEHLGPYGDHQWMRSPVMMDFWFHYDTGLGRPVTGTGYAVVGNYVCKYGRTTARTCSTVTSVNNTVTTANGTASRITFVSGVINDGGDSGGPVYVGTTAVGLTKGRDPVNNVSWFSTTDWAMLNLSTHICIDGTSC